MMVGSHLVLPTMNLSLLHLSYVFRDPENAGVRSATCALRRGIRHSLFGLLALVSPVSAVAQVIFDFESPNELKNNFQYCNQLTDGKMTNLISQTQNQSGNNFIFHNFRGRDSASTLIFDATPNERNAATQSLFRGPFTKDQPLRVSMDISTAQGRTSFGVWFNGLYIRETVPPTNRVLLALFNTAQPPEVPKDIVRFYVRGQPFSNYPYIGVQRGKVAVSPSLFPLSPDDAPVWKKLTCEYWVENKIPFIKMSMDDFSAVSEFIAADIISPDNVIKIGFRMFDYTEQPGSCRIDNIHISHKAEVPTTEEFRMSPHYTPPSAAKPVVVASIGASSGAAAAKPPASTNTNTPSDPTGLPAGSSIAFDFGPTTPPYGPVHYNHISRASGLFGLFSDTNNRSVSGVGLSIAGATDLKNDNTNTEARNYPPALGLSPEVLVDYLADADTSSPMTITVTGLNPKLVYEATAIGSYGARELGTTFKSEVNSIGVRTTSKSSATVGKLQDLHTDKNGNLVITVIPSSNKETLCVINALVIKAFPAGK